ncbi:MAG: filamentous hemagglutinin N-terminal domain-containing protein, partial [Pseudomonadota bacterium]
MTLQINSLLHAMAALLAAAAVGPLQAAPDAPVVVAGQATFVQQGNVFSITNTPNTVINWQSFNVNAGEVTRFIQQSSDSAVLNRILGQDPSQILGALQSNGHVFLINPNGIMFGRDARIDVGGLTASTLGMTNADFLSGKKNFQAGAVSGQIVNQGSISTPSGGKVYLIASGVTNNGIITAPQGQVVLAAGHSVRLVDSGNPDLHVVVSAPAQQAINLGQVIAQGGKVGIYGALVNQRGVVNANSAQLGANGKIVLRAKGDAMLEAGSVTSATGAGDGGTVTVEGERVGMTGDASIDVSGAANGGSVLLGGGYQGKNPLMRNAQQTLFAKYASIMANGGAAGKGGTVVLWSDANTRALGLISARGGAGGLVETSGKYLDVDSLIVNAAGSNGANGTWLLDPMDIEVVGTTAPGTLGDVDQFSDAGTRTFISASTLSSVAPGTDVRMQATNDVIFSAPINPALGSGSLTVEAGNNIQINAAIQTGGGKLRLSANHPSYATGSGAIQVAAGASIDTGGGSVNMDATQVDLLGPLMSGNGNITINGGNLVNFEGSVAAGTGHLTVTGNSITFGGAGGGADTGTGAMIFNNTGGSFVLGSAWSLRSSGTIDIVADSMGLMGTIGASGAVRPTVSFNTWTSSKYLDFSVARDTSALQLDPAWLATVDAQWLMIGSPSRTGDIHVFKEYSGGLANKLTFNTSGNLLIDKPITMPAGSASGLELLLSGSNSTGSITTSPDITTAALVPGGRLAADNIVLRANNMSIGASVTATGVGGGLVSLLPHIGSAQVQIGAGANDAANLLGLLDTELALMSGQELSIGGNPGQSNGLYVTPAGMDFTPFFNLASKVRLQGGSGDLRIDGKLSTGGGFFLQGNSIASTAAAPVKAEGIRFSSNLGVGTDAAPFRTEISYLAGQNTMSGGTAPIAIANTGLLEVGSVHQNGAGNQGSISISNAGGMTVREFEPASVVPVSVMTGGAGTITLKTMSPLTINGEVKTDAGMISLEAGSGGLLTIGGSGKVVSNSGNIGLTAGDVVNNGSVLTSTGNITVLASTVTGSGTFAAPAGTITGVTPTVPQCIADPSIPGCTAILKAALDACIADPSGANCAALLPSLAACIADPSIYGCVAVLPPLALCISNPATPGCEVVLPPLSACIADPSILGCSVVLPTLPQCIADPAKPGCSVVL